MQHFLQTGDIKTPLNLKDEESQLYWGAALALYAVHPEIAQNGIIAIMPQTLPKAPSGGA